MTSRKLGFELNPGKNVVKQDKQIVAITENVLFTVAGKNSLTTR